MKKSNLAMLLPVLLVSSLEAGVAKEVYSAFSKHVGRNRNSYGVGCPKPERRECHKKDECKEEIKCCSCLPEKLTKAGTISKSGSYCFANDIEGNITIAADNVKIDMNDRILNGGFIASGRKNLFVSNGYVRNEGKTGIDFKNIDTVGLRDLVIHPVSRAINVVGSNHGTLDKILANGNISTSGAVVVVQDSSEMTLLDVQVSDNTISSPSAGDTVAALFLQDVSLLSLAGTITNNNIGLDSVLAGLFIQGGDMISVDGHESHGNKADGQSAVGVLTTSVNLLDPSVPFLNKDISITNSAAYNNGSLGISDSFGYGFVFDGIAGVSLADSFANGNITNGFNFGGIYDGFTTLNSNFIIEGNTSIGNVNAGYYFDPSATSFSFKTSDNTAMGNGLVGFSQENSNVMGAGSFSGDFTRNYAENNGVLLGDNYKFPTTGNNAIQLITKELNGTFTSVSGEATAGYSSFANIQFIITTA